MDVASTTVSERVDETAEARAKVRALVRDGRWMDAEPDQARLAGYVARHIASVSPVGAEAIQGDTSELQAVRFLALGSRIRRAVGYVEVTTPTTAEAGTGFLVSPRLFLTNAHVIVDPVAAASAVVTFDRELDESAKPRPTTSFRLDPDALALFSDPDHLDYALVALGPRVTGAATADDLGYCPLSDRGDKHAIGMPVNIIQHPRGWPKMVAVRNNLLTFRTDQTLLYETDTDQGSSGSPVFNDDWELVALHHWGSPHLRPNDDHGQPLPTNVNEGIRISAIYAELEQAMAAATVTAAQGGLLGEALAYSKALAPTGTGQVLSPALPGASSQSQSQAAPGPGTESVMVASVGRQEIHVPLDIVVRVDVGSPPPVAPVGPAAVVLVPAPGAKVLKRGPEAVKLDPNYADRAGFDPAFIPGAKVPLPTLAAPALATQLATLHPDVAHFDTGELRYEHFSLKMHKAKRVAIFTATNIDGPTYLTVDRTTGKVVASEGEVWFKDSRVSASYYLDQTFYSGWSNYFDRGHLTRRTDPTWGTPAEAERANADTFHFTNCSPQHFRFNESATFWQGIERYVLENGLLATDPHKRLCVFQGPIFDAAIDRWADDVQIPSAFWKIVVWKGHAKLKAVGLVVDQLALLDEARVSLGAPHDLPNVDVAHWRVAIPAIEKRTGLDFGKVVRGADTITRAGQPAVGEEAAVRITRFEDIGL